MAYAYVQKGFGLFSTNVITWSQATGAGNLLVACFVKPDNGSTEFVSSLAGNVNASQAWVSAVGTINTIGSKIITGSGTSNFATATLVYLPGSANAGGDTTTTFTVASDQSGNRFIGAMEFSGIMSASPFINYNWASQTNAGTGSNALSSGNVNVSTAPALVSGFGYSINGGLTTGGTGTGFAGRGISSATSAYIWGED